MALNLGVLLLYCKEGRVTTFTRAWAERAVQRSADYFYAQSGGQQTITSKVYDWIKLDLTEQQWLALGTGAIDTLRSVIEAKIAPDKLSSYDHILVGIDTPTSGGGTTPGALTYLAAANFTPSFIGHELGHRFGAGDAFRETPDGPSRYENQFCVMGAKGWPAVFMDETIADPSAPGLNKTGPNMSVPTLLGTGWLKEDQHGVAVDLTSDPLSSVGGRTQELSALSGSLGSVGMRPPFLIRYKDLIVEYRVRDGWDAGLPDPGQGAGGWLVMHRSPVGAPVATYVDQRPAMPGSMLTLGTDNPVDLFNAGPPRISVLSFNAAARTVRLHLSRRAAQQPPSGETYGGVDVGGGGLVWTPGRGFTKVPPHSPLINVISEVVKVQALQEMLAVAPQDDVGGLSKETAHALRSLQSHVDKLRVGPSLSPLAHALQSITALQGDSEALKSGDEATQAFIEASRSRLTEVTSILATAVKEERRR
jgi:hypothetical protein